MFSTFPKTNFNFSGTFNLSSGNAFKLDQSKNLSFGKELTLYQMAKTLDWSELKASTDDKVNVTQKQKFFLGLVKNIVGIGKKKCWTPLFSPFP